MKTKRPSGDKMAAPVPGKAGTMIEGRAQTRGSRRGLGELVLGSWPRTLAAILVLLVVAGTVAGLSLSGRLGDLRYLNIPLVHPYPPQGYVQNPFNPTDRGDLISAAEAAKVRGDLVADGQIELRAFQTGDASLLAQSDTGRSLSTLQAVIAQNKAAGISESFENHITSVRVGRLPDPNDPSITWCVEEVGTSTITLTSTTTGAVVRQYSIKFDDKFWLVAASGHYLIADALVQSEPVTS
jgi:hypothetical protein